MRDPGGLREPPVSSYGAERQWPYRPCTVDRRAVPKPAVRPQSWRVVFAPQYDFARAAGRIGRVDATVHHNTA